MFVGPIPLLSAAQHRKSMMLNVSKPSHLRVRREATKDHFWRDHFLRLVYVWDIFIFAWSRTGEREEACRVGGGGVVSH